MRIIFGTLEAAEILKADKQIIAREQQKEEYIRDLEYNDLRRSLRQLHDERRWALVVGEHNEAERLQELINYVRQELYKSPTVADEWAKLRRWLDWVSGNPAAVLIYYPGETPTLWT